jgi:hypothetical protein
MGSSAVTISASTAAMVRQSGAIPGAEYLLDVAAVVADPYRRRRRKAA